MASVDPQWWRRAWRIPDTRPPWEWAEESMEIKGSPFGKQFNSSLTPWLRAPLEAWPNNHNIEIVCQCAVQGGKTMLAEVAMAWALSHAPNPMMVYCQTDDDARDWARERINPILERTAGIREKLPEEKGSRSQLHISFPDCWLLVQGANESSVQSKSCRWLICDEVWLWDQGLLKQARNRVTQWWNKRILITGTAGDKDCDMDEAFEQTNRAMWHLRCPSCDKLSRPAWERIVWPKDEWTCPHGEWSYERVKDLVRYRCEHCQTEHPHTERIHKLMIYGGGYIDEPKKVTPRHVGFRWNALTLSPSVLSWADLAIEWLKADAAWDQGVPLPRKEFVTRRLAESWEGWNYVKTQTVETIAVTSDWAGEKYRFLTVDVQELDLWFIARAWGESEARLLRWGRLHNWTDIEDVQRELGILDSCVFVDSSFNTRHVYEQAARHNKLVNSKGRRDWVGWKCLNGEATGRKSFVYRPKKGKPIQLPYSWPPHYVDPLAGKSGAGGSFAKLHFWANDIIKDTLVRLRDGKAQGFKWLAYDGIEEEYFSQLFSERRISVLDKYNQTKMKWERIGRRANHLWDCEAMQVVAAAMGGLLGEMSVPKDEVN